MANEIKDGYELIRKAGKKFLTEVIEEINNTGDFNILRSEAYNEFVEFYSEYKDNKKVSEASTSYLFLNYCFTRLNNLHTLSLHDFDRQSLKLNSILNDMYLIEKDISNIKYYQDKRQDIRKYIDLEEKANKTMDDLIEALTKATEQIRDEETTKALKDLQELHTASKQIVEDEKRMLAKEQADIDKLKEDDNFIGNCNRDDSIIGLLEVIYRSLATIQSIEIFLEAIYSLIGINKKIKLSKFYNLTSYSVVCKKIDMLLSLADDNNSLSEELEKSTTISILIDYIDLKTDVEKEETKKVFEAEKEHIQHELERYFELDDLQKMQEGDVDEIIDRYIIACKVNLQKVMRW